MVRCFTQFSNDLLDLRMSSGAVYEFSAYNLGFRNYELLDTLISTGMCFVMGILPKPTIKLINPLLLFGILRRNVATLQHKLTLHLQTIEKSITASDEHNNERVYRLLCLFTSTFPVPVGLSSIAFE